MNAAAFAPDGRTVALGIGDGTVAIYDPVAGRRLRTITPDPKETDNEVRSLAFSRDGKKLLIGGRGKAWLWDLTVNRALAVLSGLKGFVVSVAFHPREATILTVTRDEGKSWKGSAALWNTQTGKMIGVIQGHQDYVRCAVFSRDGSQMLTGGDDGLATLWSTEPFAPKKTFEVGKASVARVAFTHDPGRIVTAGSDGAVTLWSTASGKKISTLGKHTDEVLCLTTSLDGRLVFTGSMDCEVIQWDVAGSRPPRTLRSRPDRPYGLAFSPDGKRLASSAGSDLALIWNPASAVMMRPLEGHRKVVRAAEFSPKGEYVLTCSDDQSVRLWDSTSGQLIGRPWMGHADTVMSARFSPDGRRVVTAGCAKRNPNGSIVQQGEAILWETPSGRSLQMFQGHVGNIWDAVFSSDGKRLVTCGEDKTAIVRDLATGHILATLKGHTDMVVSAFFTPDGSQVVTAAGPKHDTRAILWDVASAKPIREFPGHRLGLSAVVPVPGKGALCPCRLMAPHVFGTWPRVRSSVPLQATRGPRMALRSIRRAGFSPPRRATAPSDTGTSPPAKSWPGSSASTAARTGLSSLPTAFSMGRPGDERTSGFA